MSTDKGRCRKCWQLAALTPTTRKLKTHNSRSGERCQGSGDGPISVVSPAALIAKLKEHPVVWLLGVLLGLPAAVGGVYQFIEFLRPSSSPELSSPQEPPRPEERIPQKNAPIVQRIQGEDRYGTSQQIALHWEPEEVETLYIASGEEFPDSVPAAALAVSREMPLLLTDGERLRISTESAIERLDPPSIAIIGGEGAVSLAVETRIRAVSSGDVRRIAGVNKYDTAALLVDEFDRTESVFIVSEGMYHVGMVSALQAGRSPGPILLVQPDYVPEVTLRTLQELNPESIMIVGGPAAVSEEVKKDLEQISPRVERISGLDRYETAVHLGASSGGEFSVVVVASGVGFGDTLSAAPLAAQLDGALLLTKPVRVPAPTREELRRIDPDEIIVLGSNSAVTDDVEKTLLGLFDGSVSSDR